ncbi:purine-binding chemotaxis protein CheW [Cryobacterium sp. MP_M5]|uniref:chemotaxis protein CheW n=1 Tax=unclassified Cryobacterium TaxID=2649013 RepID=UPI0018CA29A0|nr:MULTISPECIES: chemotaxis protein CheW [unclassified Cryobacterium]MBG6058935.1 purine-binding chemotaxis protein CheW [Cryobacterium sp. MP_M3]MEC5177056.1 purine-binding chemotaxis protein CheW [Cryobacterium sp. MP_M5]
MTEAHAVLVPVGEDLFAVSIDRVSQVVAAPPLTRLVTAPPHVLGLFNLRGQIVPLLDTAALLGLPAGQAPMFAVVLLSRQGLIALAATAFPRRVGLDDPVGPSDLPGTAGSYRVKGRVVVRLDPDLLLARDRPPHTGKSPVSGPPTVGAIEPVSAIVRSGSTG